MKWRRDGFEVDTDVDRLDRAFVHQFLAESSRWARGIPRETQDRAIQHSLNFGLYEHDSQIGFARLVTDRATFANLVDMFIVPTFRRQGLATWLLECIKLHPEVQGLRRWTLAATPEGMDLYRKAGFSPLGRPEIFMERYFPEVYSGRKLEQG